MKQHITVEQLIELSKEQRQRLKEWWKPQNHDVFIYGHHSEINQIHNVEKFLGKENALPLLSIGQMIELLEIELINPMPSSWEVEYYQDKKLCITSAEELTDALFKAVKQVL